MLKDRFLFLIALALLVPGCAGGLPPTPETNMDSGASRPSESPAAPRLPSRTPISNEPPQPLAPRSTIPAPTTDESMPPAVEDVMTPTAAETARADLAHRLNADAALVEVVDAVMRPPEPENMPCLTDGTVPVELWGRAEEVKWITLSVKGNRYHYLALGDLISYCNE